MDEISTEDIRGTLERLSLKQSKEEAVLTRTREDLKDFSFLLLERLEFEEEEKIEHEERKGQENFQVEGEREEEREDEREDEREEEREEVQKKDLQKEVNSERKERRREGADGGMEVRVVIAEISDSDRVSSMKDSSNKMSASPLHFLNVLKEEGSLQNILIPPKGDVIARTKKLPALLFSSYDIGEKCSWAIS